MNYRFKQFNVIAALLLFFSSAHAQARFAFTMADTRLQHDRRLIDTVIGLGLQQPLNAESEAAWKSAFWAMELMLYRTTATREKLAGAWQQGALRSEDFRKALAEVSYTLYPGTFDRYVRQQLGTTQSPALFTRFAEYLLAGDKTGQAKQLIRHWLKRNWAAGHSPGLKILEQRLDGSRQRSHPSMAALASKNFLPGRVVIFSLQRKNRNYPGLVIIRLPGGSFLKNPGGSLFAVPQLARAISNYPFYLTNGNTPQGVFRWTGFDTSGNAYIGPTPNLQLFMPFETGPDVFFGDSSLRGKAWQKDLYRDLLPEAWQRYPGLYESYEAGLMGRTEIIMHGTAINPHYYIHQPYYPMTPSLGCLCSYEEWNGSGMRVASGQQTIVDRLNAAGFSNGYVIVLDIDNRHSAVTLPEVKKLLKQ